MIPYVYFGILLTEVEAECSSSFGSTGKCREEAHCSQGEQTKGLHPYLSIASTCLKQNASSLCTSCCHWPSSGTFFGNI
ncbi:unnamed protein product [Sphagnum troendelagicum]|uniref:Secreted protein n=1 Tax=Sphagnum troendelagicum TaxID=128251 RepID=A0ABP0TAB9_9BRYO